MQNKEYDSLMFSLDPNSNAASPAPPELHANTAFFALRLFCVLEGKGSRQRGRKLKINTSSFRLRTSLLFLSIQSSASLLVLGVIVVLRFSVG